MKMTRFITGILLLLSITDSQIQSENIEYHDIIQNFPDSGVHLIDLLFPNGTELINNFKQHGCWCSKFQYADEFFDKKDNRNIGGAAVDELDRICKLWFQMRNCNEKLLGGSCFSSLDQNYFADNFYYQVQLNGVDSNFTCNSVNQKTGRILEKCEVDSCLIDLKFVSLLADLLDNSYNYGIENFDINPTCYKTCSSNNQNVECVGEAPNLEVRSERNSDLVNDGETISNLWSGPCINIINDPVPISATDPLNNVELTNSTHSHLRLCLKNPRFESGRFWGDHQTSDFGQNGFYLNPIYAIDGLYYHPLWEIRHYSGKRTPEFYTSFAHNNQNFKGDPFYVDVSKLSSSFANNPPVTFIHEIRLWPRQSCCYNRYLGTTAYLITNSDCNENYQCNPMDYFDHQYILDNMQTGIRFDCRIASANLEAAGMEILGVALKNVVDEKGNLEHLQITELEVYGN